MRTPLEHAAVKLGKILVSELKENDGCVSEACTELNNASRGVVRAMKETHGTAWLWVVNRYNKETTPICHEWDGEMVYNFGADFVTPGHDADLERLMREREDAEYTGTKADGVRIEAIHDRMKAVNGQFLFWS